MAFWTYILRCSDGAYYTGHTDDLERRVGEHQTGGYCDFTSWRKPVELVWSQDFGSREEALSAELVVKKWSRAKKEALMRGDWVALSHFARPPSERVSISSQGDEVYPERLASQPVEGLDMNGGGGPPLQL